MRITKKFTGDSCIGKRVEPRWVVLWYAIQRVWARVGITMLGIVRREQAHVGGRRASHGANLEG